MQKITIDKHILEKWFINSLAATYKTYCSKIPWQAYKYGSKAKISKPDTGVVAPYKLAGLFPNSGTYKLEYQGKMQFVNSNKIA